jgi:Icc-related predicted phosphoesterase
VGPDRILSCGDWGDPEEVDESSFAALLDQVPVHTTFGNHDPMELLARLRNRDDTPVLLGQGVPREIAGLRLAAIGGIWAKSHAKPHYVTDADVAEWAGQVARTGPIDILITHGCPIGLADLTPSGRHGGQRCFLEANKTIMPRLHLCGHLHVAQERTLKNGQRVINVGATPEGSIAVVEFDPRLGSLVARLERVAAS